VPLTIEFALWDGGDPSGFPVLWVDEVRLPGVDPLPAPMSVTVTSAGPQQFSLDVQAPRAAPPLYYDLVLLASANTQLPAGAGPLFGLVPDQLLFDILSLPQGIPPFRPHLIQPSFQFGPFTMPPGISLDLLGVGMQPPLVSVLEIAPLVRVTF
jgi:hypothetical protein